MFKAMNWAFRLEVPVRGNTVDVELGLGTTVEGLEC